MGKFRTGDLVSIQTTVRYGDDDSENVVLEHRAVFHRDEVTLVCPALLANEEVTITGENCNRTSPATVRATHGQLAWLELADGQMISVNAIDVHRKQ